MKHRASVVLVVAVLLLGIVIPLIHPGTASADVTSGDITSGNATYTFQDRGNIVADFGSDGQTTFTDDNVNDSDNNYTPADSSLFCSGYSGTHIQVPSNASWSSNPLTATLYTEVTTGQTCSSLISEPISIVNNGAAASNKYEWNGNNITTLPGQSNNATFTPGQGSTTYYGNSSNDGDFSDCDESAINLDSAAGNSGTLYCFAPAIVGGGRGSSAFCDPATAKAALPAAIRAFAPSCVAVTSTKSVHILGSQGSTPPGTTSSDGSGTPSLGCHIGIGIFNPLNWLLCGAILGMSSIIGVLDRAITSQLAIGTDNSSGAATDIFGDSSGNCTASAQQACNDYYQAWSSFRNIALGLMVLGGLIMLIAQALGFEVLDAYTIRKVLPRLLVAAIGITLSWQLMNFFVTLSNDLGYGVRSLIIYPFHSSGFTKDNINLASFGANGASLLAGLGGLAFGAFGLLAFAASGALALIIAFFVLILRQIAIILMIILAPIAIVAYILPNTQRIYKLWWESFSKALMMFPLIVAFIAAGHVFSLIAAQNSDNIFDQIAAFVAYFAPYFLIPATFKLAGGAIRQIGGFVNDRGRGGFDMLRKARNQKVASRVKGFRSGGVYDKDYLTIGKSGKYSVGKALNLIGASTFDADEQFGTKLGLAGAPLLGRYARKKTGQVDDTRIEHNTRLAQKLGNDSQTGWALGNTLSHFDSIGKQRFDKNNNKWVYENEDGSAIGNEKLRNSLLTNGFGEVGPQGKVSWKGPQTGAQLAQYADILGGSVQDRNGNEIEHVDSGKDAQRASAVIKGNFSTLESMMGNEELKRADWQSAGLIMAASRGKLDGDDMDEAFNKTAGEDEGFAMNRQNLLEDASTNSRPELRRGWAVRTYRDSASGKLRSKAIIPTTKEGFDALQPQEKEMARAAMGGVTGSQLSTARAETVRNAKEVIIDRAGGRDKDPAKRTESEMNTLRDIKLGYNDRFNSADQREEFGKILTELNIPMSERADTSAGVPTIDPAQRPGVQPPVDPNQPAAK